MIVEITSSVQSVIVLKSGACILYIVMEVFGDNNRY